MARICNSTCCTFAGFTRRMVSVVGRLGEDAVKDRRRPAPAEHDDVPPPLRPTRFLIAYAAAILLVDAARYLRESYHDQPAIRVKLNQADSMFGIPPDVYDTVQRSLTKPQHVWHLYHAVQYQADHADELRALGSDPLLAPLVSILDRLGHRLQVSLDDYATARIRARSRQVRNVFRRTLVEQALYGLQKLACLLVLSGNKRPETTVRGTGSRRP